MNTHYSEKVELCNLQTTMNNSSGIGNIVPWTIIIHVFFQAAKENNNNKKKKQKKKWRGRGSRLISDDCNTSTYTHTQTS